MALSILSLTLLSSSAVAVRAFQVSQVSAQRSQMAFMAQNQMESLRAFRDNHAWAQFLHGNVSPVHHGVVSAATSGGCRVLARCFHMDVSGGMPLTGSMVGALPGSYIEIMPIPEAGPSPGRVKFEVAWGFAGAGGGPENRNNILSELVDLKTPSSAVAVVPVLPPPVVPGPPPCVVGPKDIVLAMDASHSMTNVYGASTRAGELRGVVNSFIDLANVSAADNHVALVEFNLAASLRSTFSDNQASLHASMAGYDARNIYDTHYTPALLFSSGLFTASRPAAAKVLVLITDGNLTAGDTPAAATAAASSLKASGVHIYTIGIANPPPAGVALLESVATSTSDYGDAAVGAYLNNVMQAIINSLAC